MKFKAYKDWKNVDIVVDWELDENMVSSILEQTTY